MAGEIDGDIPHDADPLLVGVLLQMEPLLIENVLKEGVEGHPPGVRDGVPGPLAAIGLELVVEGGEFGVVLQPGEVELLRKLGPASGKAEERLIEQVHPGGPEMGVVHPVGGESRRAASHLLVGEQADGYQLVQVDEIGIACEGGGDIQGNCRGQGDQGQDLPIGLASGIRQSPRTGGRARPESRYHRDRAERETASRTPLARGVIHGNGLLSGEIHGSWEKTAPMLKQRDHAQYSINCGKYKARWEKCLFLPRPVQVRRRPGGKSPGCGRWSPGSPASPSG